ncbi:ABC transporter permease [Snodgrassella sp. CFCC 13594]|uniref:ABC transporter permease n=1 Tax=Snodgrassella sp. CFCC 13594 TaxID=1775559 RepID=UPI00082AA2F4|nr:ABC transporter permease [Snodgrassella sp. CFCC 13594]
MKLFAFTKEFILLSRDLHGVAVLFLMPLLFTLIMCFALSDNGDPLSKAKIAIQSSAQPEFDRALQKTLSQQGMHVIIESQSNTQLQQKIHAHQLDATIINPNKNMQILSAFKPLTVLSDPSKDKTWQLGFDGQMQAAINKIVLAQYLDTFTTTSRKPAYATSIPDTAAINTFLATPKVTEGASSSGKTPNSVQQSVPAWLIFGMFFILIPLSNVMLSERHTNTLTRLCLAQISASHLLAAKFLPYFLINQIQFMGMLALAHWALPIMGMPALSLPGSGWLYCLLSACISLSALGYGFWVSTLSQSTEQAVVLGGGGIIIMASLGGIMVPTYVMPTTMQHLSLISPMSWGLNAFQGLLLNQADLPTILPYCASLALFGLVCMLMASWRYRRQLRQAVRI